MLADDTGHSAVLKEAMSVRMEGDGPVNESPMEVECGLIVEYDGPQEVDVSGHLIPPGPGHGIPPARLS